MATEPPRTREPARRLSPKARWVWRAEWAFGSAVALAIGMAVAGEAEGVLRALLWALPLASLVAGTALVPGLRYRRWRWEVREDEIDVQHGVLTLRRTLVPMPRVQHVETTRGVLEQALGLATVQVHTAAGSHTIPLLDVADALQLRERIADLARAADA
jgi:membrane protein YdbS with pleckstrin-like domain